MFRTPCWNYCYSKADERTDWFISFTTATFFVFGCLFASVQSLRVAQFFNSGPQTFVPFLLQRFQKHTYEVLVSERYYLLFDCVWHLLGVTLLLLYSSSKWEIENLTSYSGRIIYIQLCPNKFVKVWIHEIFGLGSGKTIVILIVNTIFTRKNKIILLTIQNVFPLKDNPQKVDKP